MAGLFEFISDIFSESSNIQVYKDDDVAEIEKNSCHLTGVEKYLQCQNPAVSMTGVAKYLKIKQHCIPSGVTKYLAKRAIAQKLEPEISRTGVAEYLQMHENKPQSKLSGVAKYLAGRDNSPMTSVTKYITKKIIATRNAPPDLKTTGVTLYLENRKEVLATGVSKYVVKQVLVAKQLVAKTTSAVESITGVEKYLQAKG